MFKVKHRLRPVNIINIFKNSPSDYNLRNSDFFIHRYNTLGFGKHSLRFFEPYLWSKLPTKDKSIVSLNALKSSIRKRDLTTPVTKTYADCHLCKS